MYVCVCAYVCMCVYVCVLDTYLHYDTFIHTDGEKGLKPHVCVRACASVCVCDHFTRYSFIQISSSAQSMAN